MKNTLLNTISMLVVVLASCGKDDESSTSPYPTNTIIVTDGSATYKAEGISGFSHPGQSDHLVDVGIQKLNSTSYILIDVSGPSYEFTMDMDVKGPASGLGTYTINSTGGGNYIEKFQGGLRWEINGGTIEVTTSTSNKINATMQLELEAGSVNKTVIGTIDVNEPRPI